LELKSEMLIGYNYSIFGSSQFRRSTLIQSRQAGRFTMFRSLLLALAISLSITSALAQRATPPSKAELAEITEKGRMLAEYDVAAWYSTDAVAALNPPEGSVARYIARKTEAGWAVAYGRLNEAGDKFLIAYEAVQGTSPQDFKVKKYDLPQEDSGFYLFAARAIETTLADFKGQNRPYNVAVLPAKSKQLYVYVIPAQTKAGVYPLGADARYLISQDGSKIVEKRQLHISIIEYEFPEGQKPEAGYHTAVLDDIPEDTDVFLVLSRKPAVPEWIATNKFVYRIEVDGTVTYLMTREAFTKIKVR
jgi:hypothetical protein